MAKTGNGKDAPKIKPRKPEFTAEELKLIHGILDLKPEIVELAVSEINIDPSYQTRYRDRKRADIRDDLKIGLLGVLKVGRRPDRTYWAMDGATRVLGILDRGEKNRKVVCEVYPTDGPKIEALLFAYWNSNRSHQPTKLETRLQAYSIAGIDSGFGKAVHDCGFDLIGGGKFRHLSGISYVKQAWDLDGTGETMKKALYSCKDAWRDKHQLHGYMTLGVARFYWLTRPKSVDEQLRRLLHRKSPEDIMDIVTSTWIRSGGKSRIHPDDKPRLIAAVIAREINKNPGRTGKIDMSKFVKAEEALSV